MARPFFEWCDEEGAEYALAIQLMEQLDNFKRMWTRLHPPSPLTRSDMLLLGTMRQFEGRGETPITVSKLAVRMQQSMPGISQKVSVLERQGFIRRAADEDDRRVVALELTDKGKEQTRLAMHQMMGGLQNAMESLGDKDAHRLLELLQMLQQAIDETQEENNREC